MNSHEKICVKGISCINHCILSFSTVIQLYKQYNRKQSMQFNSYLRLGNDGDLRRLGGGAGEGERRLLAGGGDGLLLLLL